MSWTNLPTNYTDAIWSGERKYVLVNNDDGTVSLKDVTVYTQKENSFFGAADANAMNAAMNELAGNMDTVAEKATVATRKATEAESSASSAASSASTATTAKNDASSYASSASSSATTASQKATAAANSATAAANSASSASESATVAQVSATKISTLLFDNAGAHNSFYRGINLGAGVTSEQWVYIANGTFTDMYIGDYWQIGGIKWRIAAFDYYLNTGDTRCTSHHVTIVPDVPLYNSPMNSNNVTTGGYIGSRVYTAGLNAAKTTINTTFGSSHILSHRLYLCNAVTNGKPSGGSWYDSTVELMTEENVYGGRVAGVANDGASVPNTSTIDKSQFPLFAYNPASVNIGEWYWLRDVVSATDFASVGDNGNATRYAATDSQGIRPSFSIK